MTEKQNYYVIDEEEYGAYWIYDITDLDKTKEDFTNEDFIDIGGYEEYIMDNAKQLTSEEVTELLKRDNG